MFYAIMLNSIKSERSVLQMIGVLANTATIIIGSIIGLLIKKGLPERLSKAMTTATALAVVYIGISGMMSGQNTLVLVLI